MSEQTLVTEEFATGEEVGKVVEQLEAALKDVPRIHALMALTSIILLYQAPDLSTDQLYDGVRDVSRFVCTYLAGIEGMVDDTPLDKSKLN